ncbi:hypothetical protein FACS189443_2030 [Planctomycetales bacterium]|nr:hypothetical protein FACS189443_2030 [Planctomycetales bacterium]
MSKYVSAFSALCLFVFIPAAAINAAHTWKTMSGHKAVGDFVEIDADNNVVIELDDGDLTKVPLEKFSKEDQIFAKKKQKEKEKHEKEKSANEAGDDSEKHGNADSDGKNSNTTKKSSANNKLTVNEIEEQLAKDIEDAEKKMKSEKDTQSRLKKISGLKDKAGDKILKQSKVPEERVIGYRHKIKAIEDLDERGSSTRDAKEVRDKTNKLIKEIEKDKYLKKTEKDDLLDELDPPAPNPNQPANIPSNANGASSQRAFPADNDDNNR